jgi:hypothetical protein
MALCCLALAVVLGGCDPSLGPSGNSGTAWVQLFTGEQTIEPLDDGQVLMVERGSQGGVHIWGSLRAGGISRGSEDEYEALLSGDRPLVAFALEASYGPLTGDNVVREYLQLDAQGDFTLVGRRVIFRHYSELPEDWQELDWEEVEQLMEQDDLTFRVTITDSRGRSAEDSKTVRVQFPPREQEQPG